MPHMKTFPRQTESNKQENKRRYRGGLLLMLVVYSNPRWLSVVRGAVERLTETLGFPAMLSTSAREVLQLSRLIKVFEIYDNEEQALAT
jgi:hypothetical protein